MPYPPQSVALGSLRPVGTALIPAVPTLYTTTNISSRDKSLTSCASIIKSASELPKDKWLENYKLNASPTQMNDIIKNLTDFHKQLSDPTVDQLQTVEPNAYASIDTYLTKIQNANITLIQLANNCLAESVERPLTAVASDFNTEKERLDESKDRLEFIQAPEEDVSYYAGWFPLFRPMKPTMIFWLFGISLALLILSILLFLKVGGIEVLIKVPETNMVMPDFSPYVKYAIGGVGAGAVVAYLGFKRGWFGS